MRHSAACCSKWQQGGGWVEPQLPPAPVQVKAEIDQETSGVDKSSQISETWVTVETSEARVEELPQFRQLESENAVLKRKIFYAEAEVDRLTRLSRGLLAQAHELHAESDKRRQRVEM